MLTLATLKLTIQAANEGEVLPSSGRNSLQKRRRNQQTAILPSANSSFFLTIHRFFLDARLQNRKEKKEMCDVDNKNY